MLFKRFSIVWGQPVGRSDDQRFPHDHVWDYWSFVLWGSYLEVTYYPEYTCGFPDLRQRGDFKRYKAEHRHTVAAKNCWTLLYTGKPRRKWGFWVTGRNRLLRPLRYFSRYGHHQCDNGVINRRSQSETLPST